MMVTSRSLLALGLVFGLTAEAGAARSVLNRSRQRHLRFIEGTVVAVHHDRRGLSSGTITIRRYQPYHRNRSRRAIAAVGANNRRGGAETFPVNRQTRFERTPGGRTSFAAVRRGETVLIEPGNGRQRVARLVDILQGRHHYARARRAARRAIVHTTPRHRWTHRRVTRPTGARTTPIVKPKRSNPVVTKNTPTTRTGTRKPPTVVRKPNHKPTAYPRPAPKPPAHRPSHPRHPEHRKPEHKRPQPRPVHHPHPQPRPPAHKKGK
jgi:hypothetical protein